MRNVKVIYELYGNLMGVTEHVLICLRVKAINYFVGKCLC